MSFANMKEPLASMALDKLFLLYMFRGTRVKNSIEGWMEYNMCRRCTSANKITFN